MSGRRRRALIPYVLSGPGVVFLVLFFCVPLYYLAQTALQDGTLDTGYVFDWAWHNFADGLATYDRQLLRSLTYGVAATVLGLAIAYPLTYWIVMRGGRFKALLLMCIVAPFFVTYLVRTLAWQTILGDTGWVVARARDLGLVGDREGLLATPLAVIAGLTYNFLPLMALPLYASLERFDRSLLDAAQDLYANPREAFLRVTLPLSLPGIAAGSLLMFIPASGDFINAALLGTPDQAMIGNVIQSKFLVVADYPEAAALAFTVMAAIAVLVGALARLLGTERLAG